MTTPLFPRWIARGRLVVDGPSPRLMAILNVTPDSFSDGGLAFDVASALGRAKALVEEGADLLDVGGESSRPGADPVGLEEELRRVLPAIEAMAAEVAVPISVDTSKPEVARRALALGAAIVNDIGGLTDPEMLRVVADGDAGAVVMHMAGTPRTMQIDPSYGDVVEEVRDLLARRIDAAEALGIGRERLAVDPGIGFGKTSAHNLALLRNLPRFASLGCAVLVGTSRKRFLGRMTGRPVGERATASAVASLAALAGGASVVRVHDVADTLDAIKVWEAIHGWRTNP